MNTANSSDDVKIGQLFKQKVHQKDACGGGKGNFHHQNLTPRQQAWVATRSLSQGNLGGRLDAGLVPMPKARQTQSRHFFPPDGRQAGGYFRQRFGQPLR